MGVPLGVSDDSVTHSGPNDMAHQWGLHLIREQDFGSVPGTGTPQLRNDCYGRPSKTKRSQGGSVRDTRDQRKARLSVGGIGHGGDDADDNCARWPK